MPFDLRSLNNTYWLVEPNAMRRILARVAAFTSCPTSRELVEERRKRLDVSKQAAANSLRASKGKIGVIPVYGPVDQRWSGALDKAGGTSLEEVGLAFDTLMSDPSVTAILFDIDSPGGSSYGVEELSTRVFNARSVKPSYAIANSMAASAGYWLASAAGHLTVTPGGDVGSVGVYSVHVDESAALAMEGVQITAVSAGEFKTELAPWSALSNEARAYVQESVNATYSKFLSAVARNRGTTVSDVKANYGQGRVLNADQSLAAKMVDRIGSFDEVLGKLAARPSGGGGQRASVEMLRLRHDHERRKAER